MGAEGPYFWALSNKGDQLFNCPPESRLTQPFCSTYLEVLPFLGAV